MSFWLIAVSHKISDKNWYLEEVADKSLIVNALKGNSCWHLQQEYTYNTLTTNKLAVIYFIRYWKSKCWKPREKKIEKNVKKSAEKFAGKEKSRTFATRLRKNGSSLTSLRKDNEVKLEEIKLKSVTREKKS